ncbi:MAG: radical SAM protein [Thermoplasmata archaeon]|nr:radical SAM protein [Euryarchaeota archaeon]MVT35521.1 radical SAM protein [Euryarchaeota archaeon]
MDEKIGGDVVSSYTGKIDTTSLVSQFQRIVDNRFAKFILKRMTTPKKFEHALGVFAGVEEPLSISESLEVKTIEAALKRAMKTFGIDDISVIKNALKEPFVRKGVAVTLRSVAKYGITRPQVFEAPLLIVWNITKQCNLKCLHCYANAGPFKHSDELTLEEKLNLVDQLDEAGVTMLSFSGGEPLISPDFWKVAEYASGKGMYTTIATNGTLLTKNNVERLKKIGIKYVEVSLDAPEPKTHDMFRGVEGAWERTVEGIKNVVQSGAFDTAIATTATKYNLNEIPQMIDLAISLGVKKFIVFNFVPTGRGKDIIMQDLSPKEREDLLNYLYDRWQEKKIDIFSTSPTYSQIGIERVLSGTGKTYSPTHFASADYGSTGIGLAEFIGGCGAGRLYASIEDNGDVGPCVFLPIKVGNIREKSFKDIWENSKVLQELRNRDLYQENCKSCVFRNPCGGCRARAYGYFGDYLAPDPGCTYNDKFYDNILKELNLSPIVGGKR